MPQKQIGESSGYRLPRMRQAAEWSPVVQRQKRDALQKLRTQQKNEQAKEGTCGTERDRAAPKKNGEVVDVQKNRRANFNLPILQKRADTLYADSLHDSVRSKHYTKVESDMHVVRALLAIHRGSTNDRQHQPSTTIPARAKGLLTCRLKCFYRWPCAHSATTGCFSRRTRK